MAHKQQWLPYDEAKIIVHSEHIPSRNAYTEWWIRNHPSGIPKYPHRVYMKEFKGWNDWLGTDNPFPIIRKAYRPYVEAMAFAHTLKIKTKDQWLELCKEGKVPDDIPVRPDYYYRGKGIESDGMGGWISWRYFLGVSLQEKVEAAKVIETAGVLAVVQFYGRPANVFKFVVFKGGVAEAKSSLSGKQCRLIGLFKLEGARDWKSLLMRYAKEWWEDPEEWVVSNIHEVLFEYQNLYEQVRI